MIGLVCLLLGAQTGQAELWFSGLDSAIAYSDTSLRLARAARGTALESTFAEDQIDVCSGWARAWAGTAQNSGGTSGSIAMSTLGAVERGRAQALKDMLSRLQSVDRGGKTARGGGLPRAPQKI